MEWLITTAWKLTLKELYTEHIAEALLESRADGRNREEAYYDLLRKSIFGTILCKPIPYISIRGPPSKATAKWKLPRPGSLPTSQNQPPAS
jgi:hypothetical protein